MAEIAVSREQLADAFTEWDRRYREEPERFASDMLLHSGTAETYGAAASAYLTQILAEQAEHR